jgi:hypothetical protein
MTQPTTESQPYRPVDSMSLEELKLEIAKYRVIAFWGLPRDTHDLVVGDTAQEIEDKAHKLAGMLHLIPTTK